MNLLGTSRTSLTVQDRVQLAAAALTAWEQYPLHKLADRLLEADLRFLAFEVSHLLDLPVDVVAAAMENLVEEGRL